MAKIIEKRMNSGKLVYSILGKTIKKENLCDFSNFPKCGEKIECISLDDIVSCGYNKYVTAFYSRSQLKEQLGFDDISELSNYFVTYAIVLDNGKWYFGSSRDFGERIVTWLKDFRGNEGSKNRRRNKDRNVNVEMSSDARKYKRVLIIPLNLSKTKKAALEKEDELIRKFKDERFKEVTNGEDPSHYTKTEISECVKDYIYNKVNAIQTV